MNSNAISEAAAMTARAIDSLQETCQQLEADLSAARVRADANEAHSAFLERKLEEMTRDRDRYKAFSIELGVQLRNLRTTTDECFQRAAKVAELSAMEMEHDRRLLADPEPPILTPEDAPDFLKRQDKGKDKGKDDPNAP